MLINLKFSCYLHDLWAMFHKTMETWQFRGIQGTKRYSLFVFSFFCFFNFSCWGIVLQKTAVRWKLRGKLFCLLQQSFRKSEQDKIFYADFIFWASEWINIFIVVIYIRRRSRLVVHFPTKTHHILVILPKWFLVSVVISSTSLISALRPRFRGTWRTVQVSWSSCDSVVDSFLAVHSPISLKRLNNEEVRCYFWVLNQSYHRNSIHH